MFTTPRAGITTIDADKLVDMIAALDVYAAAMAAPAA